MPLLQLIVIEHVPNTASVVPVHLRHRLYFLHLLNLSIRIWVLKYIGAAYSSLGHVKILYAAVTLSQWYRSKLQTIILHHNANYELV